MEGCPITPGYTINIIRDKSKPAVILLNPPHFWSDSFSDKMTVPVRLLGSKRDHVPVDVSSTKTEASKYKLQVPDTSYSELRKKKASKDSIISNCDNSKPVLSDEVIEDNSESIVFLGDVAHEEIVIENVVSEADIEQSLKKKSRLLEDPATVFCDLCQNKFNSRSEARAHMKTLHDLTFEGPFFKCDFCSFHVADRLVKRKLKLS